METVSLKPIANTHPGLLRNKRIEDLFKIGQTEELILAGNLAIAVMLTGCKYFNKISGSESRISTLA